MNETSPQPSSADGNLGQRIVYMLVLAIAFWILMWLVALATGAQLLLRLIGGKPHADLTRFGASLGAYTRQVIEYLTFATETTPFPFGEWPRPI
jgi:hypothetical protein